jgi:hypothetical protein
MASRESYDSLCCRLNDRLRALSEPLHKEFDEKCIALSNKYKELHRKLDEAFDLEEAKQAWEPPFMSEMDIFHREYAAARRKDRYKEQQDILTERYKEEWEELREILDPIIAMRAANEEARRAALASGRKTKL